MAAVEVITSSSEAAHDALPELYDRLDLLWAHYLQLVHDYTIAQASIQKHLATGFFSLTQANFQSSGRRYGRDFYDDRAAATVRVKVYDTGSANIVKMSGEAKDSGKARQRSEKGEESTQLPSPSPTPEPEEKPAPEDDIDNDDDTSDEASENPATITDPLRWFGILTPASLRSAQESFTSAVLDEATLSKALNAARGMRDLEGDIRKLRKAIKKAEKGAAAA
ncbi:hypothetical protein M409DRAFT_19281 [Zasmidium cellare ATCC 36951]|uniref:Vacuolar ATPase assembly protein VMA22 n=1 Tax=Zasmidium cellare ATCC 36951 TaxID=1080233 RepID=A0A6A6CW84_ZASCE|nr:uncharacterized protein M409DRAFT_19281 [Zasmidium cellare ATCC 36951]KAF2170460.1 hypothetical protein M409DRAFT_19281 [Zasmidium cellare ATCC 36951]